MTLGHRLKRARDKKRLTQMDVANKIGISNGTLSGYERNYRDPDTATLSKLAELYDVSLNWLLGKEDQDKKESAYTLPESAYDQIIREVEKKYNVNLRDDPFVEETMRNIIESYARSKLKDQ